MRNQTRLTLIAAVFLSTVPLAFQNCGPGLKVLDVELETKLLANGVVFDGKPGRYVVADYENECGLASDVAKDFAAIKSEILATPEGLVQTVENCQPLNEPKAVPLSAIWAGSQTKDLFVVKGRLFQLDEDDVDAGGEDRGLRAPIVRKVGRTEIFCRWSLSDGGQGEALIETLEPVANAFARAVRATVVEHGSAAFDGADSMTEIAMEDQLANLASPEASVMKSFSSAKINVSGEFFSNKVGDGSVVMIGGTQRRGSSCWYSY